jgi:dolichyl-phosphate beta-glucosyltransferase
METPQSLGYQAYQEWKSTPIVNRPELSVVIPAYNEAARIVPTIGAIASYVSSLGRPWELIVADDGSSDETVPVLQDLGLANARILIAERNGGKGSAVQRGLMAARGAWILFVDADNSTPIEQLGPALALGEQGNHVVVGSRAASGASEQNRGLVRNTVSGILRWMVQNLLMVGVSDTQCGFKLFSQDAAHLLAARQTLMGFSFDLELLYLARKYGLRVAELPVRWYDAPGSKVDVARELRRFLQDIVRIKLNDARGVYACAQEQLTCVSR